MKTLLVMSLLEPLFQLSDICSQKNITDAILCPGSRSAALTLAFARNPLIHTHVLSDERSAAFVGLGMALQSQRTSVLVCTSGSAALNFSPAIAEAFFQEIPLLVFTADRPKEWINQYDGQTIFQTDIYGKHVKKSFELPSDYTHKDALWMINRIVNEAINLTQTEPKGPVHINIPIREPFYPESSDNYMFNSSLRIVNDVAIQKKLKNETWQELIKIWNSSNSKLIAVGQNNQNLNDDLSFFAKQKSSVVLSDIISNAHNDDQKFINSHDVFLPKINKEEFEIELLITTGKSFISKSFKQFIRSKTIKYHWHIQENSSLIDPFQSITHKIEMTSKEFFEDFVEHLKNHQVENNADHSFYNKLENLQKQSAVYVSEFLENAPFGEMKATGLIVKNMFKNTILHVGNSMPVRYANILACQANNSIEVYANRGTSGIDGIISTAVGQALQTSKTVICLLGDVSFFYDKNAFWTNEMPKNLKIIMINNNGGNIFRNIEGPSQQPELETFFVTNQVQTAKNICLDSNINYLQAHTFQEFEGHFLNLQNSNETIVLEVFCDGKKDSEILKKFKTDFVIS